MKDDTCIMLVESMQNDLSELEVQCKADAGMCLKIASIAETLERLKNNKQEEPANNKALQCFSFLYDCTLDLLKQQNVDDIVGQIVVKAAQLFQAPHGFIFLTESVQEMELKKGIGAFQGLTGMRVKAGQGFSGHVWHTGAAFYVDNYAEWGAKILSHELKTMVGVPLQSNGHIHAVLGLAFDEKRPQMAKGGLEWLRRFADVAAIAFENARVHSATIEMTEDVAAWAIAQEEIRQLSLALNQSPGVTIITDLNGCVTYVNTKFTQITGYSFDEVKGQKLDILKSGAHSDNFYQDIWDTVSIGQEWRGEFYNKKKSGEKYWALASISPVTNSEGQVVYYLEIQQDITEQKNFERILQEQNFEIKETLNQLQETQQQLIQQEKMAGIGHLAAGVAHEINNPLGFVLSNFATLQKYLDRMIEIIYAFKELHELVLHEKVAGLQEKADQVTGLMKKQKLDYILADLEPIFTETNEGLARLVSIVKALKVFSRVDQEGKFEEYNLNEGVKNSLIVAKNEIKYVATIQAELNEVPIIQAIGSQVNQVILNILVNAAHAIAANNPNDLGVITVKTYDDAEFICCSIEDTGTGIPQEIIKDIFNPFFTTKPAGKGTGLGLSISYDIIVNKHHGDLVVESEVGKGSRFIIKLPRFQQE